LLKNSTKKNALQVYKGLSRQERKKLTEELIRMRNPGISEQEAKVLMSRGILPKPKPGWVSNGYIREGLKMD
jgi:hypothetical protein